MMLSKTKLFKNVRYPTANYVTLSDGSPKNLQQLQLELSFLHERVKEVKNAISCFKDDSTKRVLFLGAGLSSTIAIEYLCKHAEKEGFYVRVGDYELEKAEAKVPKGYEDRVVPFKFDVNNPEQITDEVRGANIIVSLLPAAFHPLLIKPCLEEGKHLVTASYTSDKMKEAHEAAKNAGVIFLNEIGLDPGIDHMSCMQLINDITRNNGEVKSFESFCGGVVAPESDTNPWGYKFSWNPRNVVLAGKGVSKFIQRGQLKYIPYHKLFSRTEHLSLPGIGEFDGYANRDSLKYRELYELQHIPTFFRGTLRKRGFCKAWDIFVQLGLTDDTYVIEGSEHMTYRQFVNSSMVYRKHDSVELKLCYHLGVSVDSEEIRMLQWLGIFEERKIGLKNATPADILLSLLERKWKMRPEDKDMVVMHNIIRYNDVEGVSRELKSTMKVIGDNAIRTAMAKTVGLPLAIATRLILNGTINMTGVHIPTIKEIYDPILLELAENGIQFNVTDNLMIGDTSE